MARLKDFNEKYESRQKLRLNRDHDLEVTVADTRSPYKKETLTLKSEIISVSSDEIAFTVTSRKQRDIEVVRLLKLRGRWKADEHNRLTFAASKKDGPEDVLVLDGAWEIGRENELIYRYRKTELKRKTKIERSLIFKGAWRLGGREKLAYMLDTGGESGFIFKAQLERPYISRKLGALTYRVGIGVSERKRPVERFIRFFGALKLPLGRRNSLEFEFTDSRGRPLGFSATLTKKLLGGEAFLRFRKLAEEKKAEAGVSLKW